MKAYIATEIGFHYIAEGHTNNIIANIHQLLKHKRSI